MAAIPDGARGRAFAADARTERALLRGLEGRDFRVRRGRFAAALQALATEPSSPLVLVDLDDTPDPLAAAAEVASVCAPGTALVFVGSADTADVARTLLARGAADYLVKPVSPAAVREACAAILDGAPERTRAGRVVAVSGSAGSGVSTVTAALARAAAAHGRNAAVVDLDPASNKLAGLFGVAAADGLPALLDALAAAPAVDGDLVDGASAAAADGISLIAWRADGPLPPPPAAAAVCALLETLANRAHTVFAAGLSDPEVRLEVMRHADTRILLFEPTLQSVGAAARCLALLGTQYPVLLAQSHSRTRAAALSRAQIGYALADRRPDVVVPFDPALHAVSARGARGARRESAAWRAALGRLMEQAVEGPAGGA